ncbi:hypothetical protein [Corynebacterium cystitidis]|uniref:hypothetical protein n=1 Tax=Corynebacterium cystitidis TaxID=35757 RepID=UPI00211EA729|nr:hypothetical protein [Corynebacterium cystitidis]
MTRLGISFAVGAEVPDGALEEPPEGRPGALADGACANGVLADEPGRANCSV